MQLRAQTEQPGSLQYGQTQVVVLPAILNLPELPADITDINERYKYFVSHFWDNFDFKQKAVGQIQLDDAFEQYCSGLRLVSAGDAHGSVNTLIKKLEKNPTLLYQFCVSAENNLYDPQRAEVLIDDIYVKFLDAVLRCKKIKDVRKGRFALQYAPLHQSLVGMQAPKFDFVGSDGVKQHFSPSPKNAVVIFGHPDCPDCMMAKIKMESDTDLNALCRQGEIEVFFIIPDDDTENWKEMVADYPHYWTVGMAEGVADIYDIRFAPTIYVLDNKRNIVAKTPFADDAISRVKQSINP